MSNTSFQQAGQPQYNTKYVYYSGSDTLYTGYALCYDDATADSDFAGAPKTTLGIEVVQPATAVLNLFAGVVHPDSDGVEGPAWVRIITPTPGEPCVMYTKANATKFATALAPANGSYALAAHSDSGLNLPYVALAGETADTSTTEANKVCFFKK